MLCFSLLLILEQFIVFWVEHTQRILSLPCGISSVVIYLIFLFKSLMPCPMMQGDAYNERDNQKNIFHNFFFGLGNFIL